MPYEQKGGRFYATATKAVNHGAPCEEVGVVGVASKQVEAPAGTGLGATALTQVAIGEAFVIITHGIVQVAYVATAAKGSAVYITTATNALTLTPGVGKVGFGRVMEIQGQRGTPTGFMRVDLDDKNLPTS